MAGLSDVDRKALLKLARSVIKTTLVKDEKIEKPDKLSAALKEKRGCFVTLHKNGALRGCIGTIEPSKSLSAGVEENAVNSAFKDPRFPAMVEEELGDIDIEVSVLTVPRILEFKGEDELLKKLKPGIHGVILSHGWRGATFLPQVWDQLPDKKDFLKHLCMKAGLGNNCWKDKETVVKIYEAEYFSEAIL
jgi:AmmeMemoRadiSam system protein A